MMSIKRTILALPHAGGSSYNYYSFRRWMPEDVQFIAVDLPGHGTRIKEPLLNSIPAMALDIISHYQSEMHEPYILFGHSMGATLAYQICCQLATSGMKMPEMLVVSGRQDPFIPETKQRSLLPRNQFISELKSLGGTSDALVSQPEFFELFEPVLRADFRAVESYAPSRLENLSLPVMVLAGREDQITPAELESWREVTTGPVSFRKFPGGHFYLFQNTCEIASLLVDSARSHPHLVSVSGL